MKTIIFVLTALFAIQASAIENKPIEDYALNEINRLNTWEGHALIQFTVNDVRFGVGFWPQEHPTLATAPFAALIAWTPQGWKALKVMGALWNDNLQMYTGSVDGDIAEYMWFVGQTFTPVMKQYLVDVGALVVPSTNWGKVLFLLDTVNTDKAELTFDRSVYK